MSDLSITILVPPEQAIAGSKAITKSVGELEKQGKQAQQAFSSLAATMVGLPTIARQFDTPFGKVKAGFESIGFNARAAKEKINEFAKNASWGLMQTGIQKANEALSDFGITLGTTGASIGYQLAGPLGAVAGAAGEIIGTKLGDWLSESDRAARDAAVGYIEAARQMDAFAAGVEKAELAHSRMMRQLQDADPLLGGTTRILNQQADAWQNAATKVLAYGNATAQLQVGKLRSGNFRSTVDDVTTARGLRDAQLELSATTATYGGVLTDVIGKENKRKDAIEDAKAALAAGAITQSQYTDYMKQFTVHASAATVAARGFAKAIFDIPTPKFGSNAHQWEIESAQRDRDVLNLTRQEALAKETARNEALGIRANPSGWMSNDQINASARGTGARYPTDDAKKLQSTVDDLAMNSLASLEQAAQSAGDALVEAFTSGEFSAKKFFDMLASMTLKAGVSNLINFGFANIKGGATGFDSTVGSGPGPFLPGFATGGDMMVGGAGGTDTRLAMFKVTPGESIHVRTPQQREAAQASRSAAPVVNVRMSNQVDRRALLEDFEGPEGIRTIANVIRSNRQLFRKLL